MDGQPRDPDCLDDATLLSLAQGALDPDAANSAKRHLEQCARCRRSYQMLTRVSSEAETLVVGGTMATANEQLPEHAPPPAENHLSAGADDDQQLAEKLSRLNLLPESEATALLSNLSLGESLLDALRQRERLTPYQLGVLAGERTGLLTLGSYEILDEIGLGGMGVVYKAKHRHMRRIVALKVLVHDAEDGDAMRRFQREVEAAARLHHFNIAAAYDAEEADGLRFLAMEFVDGPNLSRYVRQHGAFEPAVAVRLALQAARGLAHAHRQGVIHRDIKPSNLAVTRQGVVKILDMGLAQLRLDRDRSEEELTQSGRVMGTVDFMAPEQAKNAKDVDPRADIYSLGCTLHYLLAGGPMSPDGSLASKLLWHQVESPPELTDVVPDAPLILQRCFAQAVSKSPEERQDSMDIVVDQLSRAVEELPAASFEFQGEPIHVGSGAGTVDAEAEDQCATFVDDPTRNVAGEATISMDLDEVSEPQNRLSGRALAGAAIVVVGIGLVILGGGALAGYFSGVPARPEETPTVAAPQTPASQQTAPPPQSPQSPQWQTALRQLMSSNPSCQVEVQDPSGATATLEEGASPPPNATISRLSIRSASNQDFKLLATLPIQALTVYDASLTAENITDVASIASLEELELQNVQLANDALYPLAAAGKLTRLKAAGSGITNRDLAPLIRLRTLRALDISDSMVTDEGVNRFANLKSLEQLIVRGSYVTSVAQKQLLAANPQLRIIGDSTDADRESAAELLNVHVSLHVRIKSGRLQIVSPLDPLPSEPFTVEVVDARECSAFKREQLAVVARLTGVKELFLGRSGIDKSSLGQFPTVESLRRIDFGRMRLNSEELNQLRSRAPNCDFTFSPNTDQIAAEKVVAEGRMIRGVTDEGSTFEAKSPSDLPAEGDYWITHLELPERSDAESFVPLRQLGQLNSLSITIAQNELLPITDLKQTPLERLEIKSLGDETPLTGLSQLAGLRALSIQGGELDKSLLTEIGLLRRLESLKLTNTRLTAPTDAWLLDTSPLKRLTLRQVDVDDAWVEPLGRASSLEYLEVHGTRLTDAAVEELTQLLPKCEIVSDPPDPDRTAARWVLLQGGRVEFAEGPVTGVSQLPRGACQLLAVSAMDNSAFPVNDLPSRLAACRSIRRLNVSGTRISNGVVSKLPATWPLEEFLAAETALGDEAIGSLGRFKSLKALDLTATSVRGATLQHLPLRSLHSLKLANTPMVATNIPQLAVATKLAVLDLNGVRRIGDEPFQMLEKMTLLRELGLRSVGITDASLEAIRGLRRLQRLELGGNTISSGGLASLSELKELVHLNLQQTGADDGTLSSLSTLPRLRSVNALQTDVSAQGVSALKAARPEVTVQFSPRRPKDQRGGRFDVIDPGRRP